MADDISGFVKSLATPAAEYTPQELDAVTAEAVRKAMAPPPAPVVVPQASAQPVVGVTAPEALPAEVVAPQMETVQSLPIVTADYSTPPEQAMVPPSLQGAPPPVSQAPQAPILPPDAFSNVIEPTQEELSAKIDSIFAPTREAKAQALALDEIDKMRADADARQKAREEEVKQEFATLDGQVRNSSLNQLLGQGTFGQRLGAIIALGMGAVSQGLSGAKTNPVVDFFDRAAEQQAARDKLTLEQKQMLKRQLYEQGSLELQKLENATNNAFRKDQIRLQRDELNAKRDAVSQELLAKISKQRADASKWNGKALTPEQEATLTTQERRNIVHLPDGRKVLAQSYEDANQFKTQGTEIYNALSSIDELRKLGKSGSKLSPNDLVTANALVAKIVGSLRLPYTGPGVMTKEEREMLIEVMGNPLAWNSWRSREFAKLDRVRLDLQANLQNIAKVRGIREQVVPTKFYNVGGRARTEDELVQEYRKQLPNMSEDRIKAAIQKTLPSL
jgi:hypothetical protein